MDNNSNNKMNDYLNSLKEKYGYSDDLTNALGKIVPAFINHYGKENEHLILEAISSCEIHIQEHGEDPNEFIKNYFPEKQEEKIPLIASAFYDSCPVIKDGKIDSKRVIYLSETKKDLNDEKACSALVHEMGHLIKSYNGEYKMIDGKIYQRSGIIESEVTIDEQTGKYIENDGENTGLEEAINCYDEEKIMSEITGKPYRVESYFNKFNQAINPLFAENKELIDAFKTSQLNGTDAYKSVMGKESFEKFSGNFKEFYDGLLKIHKTKQVYGSVKNFTDEMFKKMDEFKETYNETKNMNFSIDSIEKIDKSVSFEERQDGMNQLKDFLTQEKQNQKMEEKLDDVRV